VSLFDGLAAPAPEESGAPDASAPLAERMRPRSLDEFVGQEKLVGEGRLLRELIAADRFPSLIFWGPPGTGKTTLGRIVAARTGARFVPFSAVTAGVADVRAAVAEARHALRLEGRRSCSSMRSTDSTAPSKTPFYRTSRRARSSSSVRRPRTRVSR